MRHREAILDRQYLQARLADAATEIYMMSAVVARLERMLDDGGVSGRGGAGPGDRPLLLPDGRPPRPPAPA